jgi:carbon monoxide dehydrogenase subunit G
MNFHFSGAPEVAAPVSRVWRRLLDPQAVGNAGPGVQRVKVIDPYHFEVVTGFRIAAFKLEVTMKVELADVAPERRLRMVAKGKARGSSIQVISLIQLEPVDENRTRLSWDATTEMGGIVAAVGGSRLEGLARDLTQRFWDRFIAAVEKE